MTAAALLTAPASTSGQPDDDGDGPRVVYMPPALVPGSPAWLEARRLGVGGSDVAAALGLSDFTTPYELYLDKVGELPPRVAQPRMRWGNLLEPVVRHEYAVQTGRRVVVPGSAFRSLRFPWMLANLDGQTDAQRLLECKTARTAEGWGEAGSADIPVPYLLQSQHYLVVMAATVIDVAVLIGGSDFRIYTVEADRELQQMIVDGTQAFWQRVADRDPPPVTTIEDARMRWGGVNAKGNVQASEAALQAVATLRDATQHRKDLEGVEAEHKAFLMGVLGEAGDTLVDVQGRPLVTWKQAKAPEEFDTAAFKAEHPGLYVDYLRRGTPSRKFLLKNNT